ncbi:HisA/HisF-related TIM barrel protein [Aquabacterium sp. OR-4]|uniref:HisA/HisF-related TIM barrel protein n=1 Tax=Aquabacterium sp. OR-4 TaxID=2978127 RepID=UPI0021B38517|nr:HisA/HisF-related TIM barrel protein [Aquabacterium sp. OR-4]MDT7838292.1 HisA/HisF-related TIM barrel protein [Aquabacterium sp. OR-4]
MQLIPVIDLMHGQVVRARGGQRALYRPMQSQLCAGSAPLVVARALLAHCRTETLYLADLDALTGGAPQQAVLASLLAALPRLQLWLDAGFASAADARQLRDALGADGDRLVPVFGSESLRSAQALDACFGPAGAWQAQGILSLDRRGTELLDAAGCWQSPGRWPQRLIVMTLERVGSGAGPNLDTLRWVRERAPQALLAGAGGLRDEADLQAAAAAGADAWLVASALHDGRLAPRGGHRTSSGPGEG